MKALMIIGLVMVLSGTAAQACDYGGGIWTATPCTFEEEVLLDGLKREQRRYQPPRLSATEQLQTAQYQACANRADASIYGVINHFEDLRRRGDESAIEVYRNGLEMEQAGKLYADILETCLKNYGITTPSEILARAKAAEKESSAANGLAKRQALAADTAAAPAEKSTIDKTTEANAQRKQIDYCSEKGNEAVKAADDYYKARPGAKQLSASELHGLHDRAYNHCRKEMGLPPKG